MFIYKYRYGAHDYDMHAIYSIYVYILVALEFYDQSLYIWYIFDRYLFVKYKKEEEKERKEPNKNM